MRSIHGNPLVRVTDQHGAFLERSLTVSVLNVVEDWDTDGVEDHYDPDDDGDGFEDIYELTYGFNPMDQWDYPKSPLITTGGAWEENGTLVFGANVRSTGGFRELELGISLYDHTGYFLTELHKPWSAGEDTNTILAYELALEPGQKIFYEAYAQNPEGRASGQRVAYWIGGDPALTKWWGGDAVLADGWRESFWFGTYLPNLQNNWIYHLQLGWVYAQTDGVDGMWLWMDGEDWLWTKEAVWPFLLTDSKADWLYPIYSKGNRYFYDYSTETIRR